MQSIEKQKDKSCLNPLSSKSRQTDYIQSLDEAFCVTEKTVREAELQSLLLPFTTKDCQDLFLVNEEEPNQQES